MIPTVARIDCNLLLEGESGTGKNFIARAIHEISSRKSMPFIVVNCGALPEQLIESELFGYAKGAFTGADKDKPGKFAVAGGGTILLDEISEIPMHIQVKLLRVIEEKSFEPIGSNYTQKSSARIMSATNKDLKILSSEGAFRTDLFYRLNTICLKIPPLRERPLDIEFLVNFFLKQFSEKYQKKIDFISEEAMNFLLSYDYPGNIRELKNIMERAIIFCRGNILNPENIMIECKGGFALKNNFRMCGEPAETSKNISIKPAMKTPSLICECEAIIDAINKCNGNKTMAANLMKMHKTTLWRKIKKYGMDYLMNNRCITKEKRTAQEEIKKILDILKTAENRNNAAKLLKIDRSTLWRKMKKYGLI